MWVTGNNLHFVFCILLIVVESQNVCNTQECCQTECKSQGFCCNDVLDISSNHYFSCLQACMMRVSGDSYEQVYSLCAIQDCVYQHPVLGPLNRCGICDDVTNSDKCMWGMTDISACFIGAAIGRPPCSSQQCCEGECQIEQYCCNDALDISSNHYFSCLQACMMRVSGDSYEQVYNLCPIQDCFYQHPVLGPLNRCELCDDVTNSDKCVYGVTNLSACLAGAKIGTYSSVTPTPSPSIDTSVFVILFPLLTVALLAFLLIYCRYKYRTSVHEEKKPLVSDNGVIVDNSDINVGGIVHLVMDNSDHGVGVVNKLLMDNSDRGVGGVNKLLMDNSDRGVGGVNKLLMDNSDIGLEHLNPICGLRDEPLLKVEESTKPLISVIPFIDAYTHQAILFAKHLKENSLLPKNISKNEAAAINLYTREWTKGESLYLTLNSYLRKKERHALKPFFPYLCLFIHSLRQLPCYSGNVWRGVKEDLNNEYLRKQQNNEDVIWWGFSSCTEDVSVIRTFLDNENSKTLFMIEIMEGYKIGEFSCYRNEAEVLLLPASTFKVVAVYQNKGFNVVHLKQKKPDLSLLDI